MKLMEPKDYPTDLKELSNLLKEAGIEHILKEHPVTKAENAKKLIGYNLAGDWQITIGKELSVIRGMVSWGDYEAFDGKEVKRAETAEEMVKIIKGEINERKD